MAVIATCIRRHTFVKCYYNIFNSYLNCRYFCNIKNLSIAFNYDGQKSEGRKGSVQVPNVFYPYINDSVEDILERVEKRIIFPNDSVILLKALRIHTIFKKINPDSFVKDERFQSLCKIFETACEKLHPNVLVSGLRSLLEVGVPSDADCITTAEEIALQKIEEFNMCDLIGCLYFHQKYIHTNLQKVFVSTLVKEIQMRISEISTGSEIFMLLRCFHLFNYKNKLNLEEKLVELCAFLDLHELIKVVCLLAETSHRNRPILNEVSKQLIERVDKPDIKDVIDILYALKTLNFSNENLMLYLLDSVVPKISSIAETSLISRLLTVCGHLKLKHHGVLDACGNWILNNLNTCRIRELTTYIITLSALNYSCSKSENILKTILPLLSPQKVESLDLWLDVIWSLAVLNNLERQTLQEILSAKFFEPLIVESNVKAMNNKLKLMNLKGFMELKYPECIFGCDLILEPIEIPQSLDEKTCRRNVIQALSNFVPKAKYMCINQNTTTGIFIDAEFIIDKNGKPLPLFDYGVLANTSKPFKPLPKEAKRFALIVLFYNNFTLNEHSLTGISALTMRLLAGKYHAVVQVPYDEFVQNKTEVEKTKYLQRKINECMTTTKVNQS